MLTATTPPHILAHDAAMLDRFGYRPVATHACPRVVAGRRCLGPSWTDERPDCLCLRYHSLLDHGRLWRDRRGFRVLTAEPYSTADAGLLPDFVAACAALGLTVSVDPESPWCPGWTVLLTVRRRPTARAVPA